MYLHIKLKKDHLSLHRNRGFELRSKFHICLYMFYMRFEKNRFKVRLNCLYTSVTFYFTIEKSTENLYFSGA